MDTMTATESYCRCGYETEMELCPKCGSPARFIFTTAQVQEHRPSRWIYLVAGLVLEAVPLGATVWVLS
jgi:hypothetical protein